MTGHSLGDMEKRENCGDYGLIGRVVTFVLKAYKRLGKGE
jgi:hypothetical protein